MAVEGEGSLLFKTGLDNTGLKAGASEATGIIQAMSKNISKINPFAALAIAAVASLAIIGNAAFKMAKEFETAMAEVRTISNETGDNFREIEKSVFLLSKVSIDKPAALAKAYYQLVSAGFDGTKGLELLAIASKAAVAGITDTETAADGLTTVLNAFKLEASEAEYVADILFNTVKLGKTTFGELATNLSTVAPIAAASGVAFAEVAAAIASLTKSGVPTAQAMTQIRSAIIGTNEALGDGWSETMTLVEAFQFLYDKAGGSQTELQGLVGRIEAVSGILGVAGINAASATADFESMSNVLGSTSRAFDIMINTNENQWKLFGNNIRSTIIGMGNDLLSLSSGLARGFNSLFTQTIDKNKQLKRSFDDNRKTVFKLRGALQRLNEESDERAAIIKKITLLYPNFIKGIDTEKVSNQELLDILDKVNESYKTRFKFELRQSELQEQIEKQALIEITVEDVAFRFKEQLDLIAKLADDRNIPLNFDYELGNTEFFRDLDHQINEAEIALGNVTGGGLILNTALSLAVKPLFQMSLEANKLGISLSAQTKVVDDLVEKNEKLLAIDLKRASGREEAIRQIEKASNVEQITQFADSGFSDVQAAYDKRIALIEKLTEISNINKADLAKDPNILAKFLQSENKEIKKAAEDRKKLLSLRLSGGTADDDDDTFEKQLAKQRDAYEAYNLALEAGDKELAQKIKDSYDLKHEQYVHYLQGLFAVTEDFEDKIIILKELKDSDGELRQVLTPIDTIHLKVGAVEIDPEYTKSLKTLNRELQDLQDEHYESENAKDREALDKKIELKQKEIDVANNVADEKVAIEQEYYNSIRDISRRELVLYISTLRKKLSRELALQKANIFKTEALRKASIARIKKLEGEIKSGTDALGDKTQEAIRKVSDALRGAGELFAKFGNEDMAELLNQLAGVADGVGKIVSGDIIGGTIDILNSALTVTIESDTAKFEKEIERLSIVLQELGRDIAAAIGIEKIDTRIDQLREEGELLEANRKALQAELDARKTIKFLGIKVGDKGKGSGTDEEAVKDFEDAIDELEHRLVQLQLEIYETLTGATATSITDSIIKGFADGKSSIEDFAGTFEDLMKKAIIETFKLKYLEQATQDFFELFGTLAESDSALTAEEIAILRASFADLIANSEAELAALNDILSSAGIDGGLFSDSAEADGLSGQIRREITEETGTILAGLMRRVADDVSLGLAVSREAVENLVLIQTNTFNTVTELQRVNIQLETIEDNTRQSLLHDLGG